MKKWKYQRIDRPEGGHPESWFNDIGDDGWDLVGFDADYAAWFKRVVDESLPAGCDREPQ